jgi:hypothetical protein
MIYKWMRINTFIATVTQKRRKLIMKKIIILCLAVGIVGLQVFQSQADTLTQGLNYMNVQQRNVENGNTYNRLYFSMYDQNQTPPGDVLASATLYDPNGEVVNIPFPTYTPVNLLMGNYDGNNGQWNFSSGFDYFDNGYAANFDGDLIPGDYRLQVTTINGSADELTFKVSAPVECPIISSSSFHVWIDQSDNLVWEWALPSIAPGLNTSISAYIKADGDDENFLWISVPTDVNRITIPKTTVDLLKTRGANVKIGLNLRINDEFGNNFQRNISNSFSLNILGSQGLEYMYVQQRNYENGNTFNRLYFSMYDQSQTPPGDVLASATLYDPNGEVVNIAFPTYAPGNLLTGYYDGNNGQWNFSSGFDYFDNGYAASFAGDLVPGFYRLQVTTTGGWSDERTFKVSQPVACPIISSSSFRAWKDSSGNLIWEWDPPYAISPILRTRISAYIGVEEDNEHFFWITVPTHFGGVLIPKNKLELLEAKGNKIIISLSLRINDEFGNNFQRNISNGISLVDAMNIPVEGDVNNDGKIGVAEAIHALQIATGSN